MAMTTSSAQSRAASFNRIRLTWVFAVAAVLRDAQALTIEMHSHGALKKGRATGDSIARGAASAG